jgi:hypothetical protein
MKREKTQVADNHGDIIVIIQATTSEKSDL